MGVPIGDGKRGGFDLMQGSGVDFPRGVEWECGVTAITRLDHSGFCLFVGCFRGGRLGPGRGKSMGLMSIPPTRQHGIPQHFCLGCYNERLYRDLRHDVSRIMEAFLD